MTTWDSQGCLSQGSSKSYCERSFAIQNPNIFSCPLNVLRNRNSSKLTTTGSDPGHLAVGHWSYLTWSTVTFIRSSPHLWKCFTGFMTKTRVGPWLLENFTLSHLHVLSFKQINTSKKCKCYLPIKLSQAKRPSHLNKYSYLGFSNCNLQPWLKAPIK